MPDLHPVLQALGATAFTWFVTALGAATIFLSRDFNRRNLDAMLGFAGGVMIAASFWSLLAPVIEMAGGKSRAGVVAGAIGFLAGGALLWSIDHVLPHLHLGFSLARARGHQDLLAAEHPARAGDHACTTSPRGSRSASPSARWRRGYPRPRWRRPSPWRSASACRICRRAWR